MPESPLSTTRPTTDWTDDGIGLSRCLGGLGLRVFSHSHDDDEPWTHEVLLAEDDVTEFEIASGGAATLDGMKAAAETAAVAYGSWEDTDG